MATWTRGEDSIRYLNPAANLRTLWTDPRAQLSALSHKKGSSSSDRKESGNAEGCESTGRIAVFRVSSRDDGPVALAEAGSVI